jgi:hypothetical protein
MNQFFQGVIAFVMGAINVGAGVERQKSVQDGNLNQVAFMTILITIAGAIGTSYQVEKNWTMYGIMSSGVLAVTLWMAYRAKKKREEMEKESNLVPRAAGFLVIGKDRSILMIERKGDGVRRKGMALPVNKCKMGEPAINAAYRALRDEAGIPAVLLSHTPFMSWEDDGYVVEIFAAIAKNYTPTKENVVWGHPNHLIGGAYPHFNRAMLEHFASIVKW